MFCKNCGSSIDEKAVICPHCGVATDNKSAAATKNKGNAIAVVGFIFSFFIALVGLICSILGYRTAVREDREYKGLAVAGIIISAVSMFFAVILYATILL